MGRQSSPRHLARRKTAEQRFRWYGRVALAVSFCALALLLFNLISQGYHGFERTEIRLTVMIDEAQIDPQHLRTQEILDAADYQMLVRDALKSRFPQIVERRALKEVFGLISDDAGSIVKRQVLANPALIGQTIALWLPASAKLDAFAKGSVDEALPAYQRGVTDSQLALMRSLKDGGQLRVTLNPLFFTGGDSRQPEQAGFLGAVIGSLLTLLVCMALAFPLGVMTAVYLEEFAPRNRFVEILEVNINNLAAIPSIIYGLLGLSLYLNFMHLPRSASVVGGLTLALLILPVVVISTRVAISAVPPSVRDAALALGASPLQVVWHQVLPLALPGIMTGTILGLARAIGETAPLLMIGMVAFVSDIPHNFTDPATVMPVQIYLWSSNPESAFVEKTAAGILVLLAVLISLNALAIYIRKRFEVRW